MKKSQAPQSKLIVAKGVFVRVSAITGQPNYDDKIVNPTVNGFWAVHKIVGGILCVTTGPHKGMWLERQ